eukprot:scaffold192095_cov36-Tisochrysis_lutea.AAC.2
MVREIVASSLSVEAVQIAISKYMGVAADEIVVIVGDLRLLLAPNVSAARADSMLHARTCFRFQDDPSLRSAGIVATTIPLPHAMQASQRDSRYINLRRTKNQWSKMYSRHSKEV